MPAELTIRLDPPARRLETADRDVARALRNAARTVGHAGLPAEYRLAGFEAAVELELERIRARRLASASGVVHTSA